MATTVGTAEGYRVELTSIEGRRHRIHLWTERAWSRLAPESQPRGAIRFGDGWVWLERMEEVEADAGP